MLINLVKILEYLDSNHISYEVNGDNIDVKKMASINANVHDSFCYYVGNDPVKLRSIERSIIICNLGFSTDNYKNTYILTQNPQLSFYLASSLFASKSDCKISCESIISEHAEIGNNASIGPFCNIEKCKIGENVIIESGVKVKDGTVIGNNVYIQENTVIGATGVLWAWGDNQTKIRCVQTGNVIIKDNVFIGANITIVKGTFENSPTIIGGNTMIAHGTMIGHGVVIGENNHFANNVSIAGSVITGDNCFFGSGVSVRPHIKLADDIVVGTGAVVVKDFEIPGITIIGNPAKKIVSEKGKKSGVPAPLNTKKDK